MLCIFCTISFLMVCSQRLSTSITRKRRPQSNVALAAAVAKKVVEHNHKPWLQADYVKPHFFHYDNTNTARTDSVRWVSRGLNLTLLRTAPTQPVQVWLSNQGKNASRSEAFCAVRQQKATLKERKCYSTYELWCVWDFQREVQD